MRFTAEITECSLSNGIMAMVFETGKRRIYSEVRLDSRAQGALVQASDANRELRKTDDFIGLTLDVEVKEVRVRNGDSVLVATDFYPFNRRL